MVLYIDCAESLVIAGIATIAAAVIAQIGLIALILWMILKGKDSNN